MVYAKWKWCWWCHSEDITGDWWSRFVVSGSHFIFSDLFFWDYNISIRSVWVIIRDLIMSFSISCFVINYIVIIIFCKVFMFLLSMCCLLVRTSYRYSEKESILSHSTENSWSMKAFNEFSLRSNWTIHSFREFSKTGWPLGLKERQCEIMAEWVVFTLYIYTMYTFLLL